MERNFLEQMLKSDFPRKRAILSSKKLTDSQNSDEKYVTPKMCHNLTSS